jgi:hypothetical protein
MIAEAIQAISNMARAAMQPTVLLQRPSRTTLWDPAHSAPFDLETEPAPRDHVITSITDLIDVIGEQKTHAEVFHDATQITAVLDNKTRRDFAVLPLEPTRRWQALMSLREAGISLSPSEAVRFLRFNLPCDETLALIPLLRRVDFKRSEGGHEETAHGRESLGRAVEASIQGTAEIPESIVISLRAYSNHGLESAIASVQVGILLEPARAMITFRVIGDSYLDAALELETHVHDVLTTALGCTVSRGKFHSGRVARS